VKRVYYLLPALLLVGACHKQTKEIPYEAVPVSRRDIVVTAEASGAINPDTVVEVKSKASGEILAVNVQTGDYVKQGTLLVQVDQRIPANDVKTALATLAVDSAQLNNAKAQLNRQQELYRANAVTQQDLETAQLAVAQANASVVRDNIAYQNAEIALGDTKVLAPIDGTVIEQDVQRGTVISSPTNSASGGSVLLKLADLSLVQVKTMVDETDVAKLSPGQEADVSVTAYPNQVFRGTVLKIEPQADTIQNVTMFPVDIGIDNRRNMLKPGMSADVRVQVASRTNVLAVPNGALRTDRDVASAASVLGISQDQLTTMLADAQKASTTQQRAAADTGTQPQLDNHGDTSAMRGGAAGQMMASRGNGQRDTTGGANRGRNGGGRGRFGGGGRGGRGGNGANNYLFGGRYIVFALRDGKPTPVYVQTGVTDLDYSEVLSGLTQGDSVLMLPSASMIQQQQQMQQRMSRNSGLPGQSSANSTSTGNRGSSGGGGGGGRGGRGG
jgi:HlyD family secretion protein